MSTPLGASLRIELRYSVNAILHKYRGYVTNDPVPATPRHLIKRDGVTSVVWTTVAQDWWNVAKAFYVAAVQPPLAVLEALVGGTNIWQPVDTFQTVGVGTNVGVTQTCQQATWVLRDQNFHPIHAEWFETAVGGWTDHSANGLGSSMDAWTNTYNGTLVATNNFYNFQVGRSGLIIAVSGSVAGWTLTANRKLRRRRGLT